MYAHAQHILHKPSTIITMWISIEFSIFFPFFLSFRLCTDRKPTTKNPLNYKHRKLNEVVHTITTKKNKLWVGNLIRYKLIDSIDQNLNLH